MCKNCLGLYQLRKVLTVLTFTVGYRKTDCQVLMLTQHHVGALLYMRCKISTFSKKPRQIISVVLVIVIAQSAGVQILGFLLEFNTMEPLWYFRSPFELTLLVRQKVVFSIWLSHVIMSESTYKKKGRTFYYNSTVC